MPLVTVVLVGGLLLGGCSGDPEPIFEEPAPSVSTVPEVSVSASPTVEAPTATVPPALEPAELIQEWVGAWNSAFVSGDTAPLRRLETPDCRNCAAFSGVIDDVFSAGGSFTGGEWSIVSSKVVPLRESRVRVEVAVHEAAGSTINSEGEAPVRFEANNRMARYYLKRVSGQWLIDAIEVLS
ncbi:MAG TPA: hypothetical protein DEQ43_05900 [Nocardioides bacterium]|nr:hypothetical protein [Nocardioides sp.]